MKAATFVRQAQLKPETLPKLESRPGHLGRRPETISKAPFRGWDPEILKERRLRTEAITHYGNAIKLLINEKFGDGIMSAIDFYMTVGGTGQDGRSRITLNGKFLPFIEQVAADNRGVAGDRGRSVLVLHTLHNALRPPYMSVQ